MSLEYLAISNGSRTPDGRTLPGATTGYTRGGNRTSSNTGCASGRGRRARLYLVGGQDFQLNCGWNRQYYQHGTTETSIIGWFDAVRAYNWQISGLFYPC